MPSTAADIIAQAAERERENGPTISTGAHDPVCINVATEDDIVELTLTWQDATQTIVTLDAMRASGIAALLTKAVSMIEADVWDGKD